MEKTFHLPWQVPFGDFSLKLDPLSRVFLATVIILIVSAGIYGIGYLRRYAGKKPLGFHLFFYLVLSAAFALIMTAHNIILFLAAWEAMSISTYFLIVFHDEKPSVREAGFLYLIATHCGTFCLLLMFFLMASTAGSMDFSAIARTSFSPALAGAIFFLALLGFGVKSGFLPFHIWLPQAHPAAPAHISALLSGIAIKTGIYGICRVVWMIGVFPEWCGYALLSIGVVSGIMGVLYALGQHEIKRLLSYHSIENIGIIALGLGVGLLGRSHRMPFLSSVGFAGAIVHVFNHALFKGLLFLGAGSVIQKTHTGEMDRMGGLAKTMPVVSTLFLVGALAICGLPLFNGFISEFIIYLGLFQGLLRLPLIGAVSCAVGILSLVLMGALALVCFTKVYGTVFLGEPRRPIESTDREDTSFWAVVPLLVLAGLCVWVGLAPGTMVSLAFLGGEYLAHVEHSAIMIEKVMVPLSMVIGSSFIFLAVVSGLVFLRRVLLRGRSMPVSQTWSCGFSQVTPRFQYTSSSFARPVVDLVKSLLFLRRHGGRPSGFFPGKAHVHSAVHDASEEILFRPLFVWLTNFSKRIDDSRIRHTQMYLMYIFLFLIFLLVWKLK